MSRVNAPVMRNGFPFPIVPATQWDGETFFEGIPSADSATYVPVFGGGTYHPLALTLPELVRLYWRSRFMRVAVTPGDFYSGIYPSGFVFTLGGSARFDLEYGETDPLINELKPQRMSEVSLVASPATSGGIDVYVGNLSHSFDFEFHSDIDGLEASVVGQHDSELICSMTNFELVTTVVGNILFGSPRCLTDGSGMHYPQLLFQLGNWGSDLTSSVKYNFSDLIAYEQGSLDMLGQTIKLYGTAQPTSESVSTTATVTPQKYWSYDGLWDEDSGAWKG